VLADVSLAVEEGELLALLGPSGSGKTTLLRVLAGFESPDRGRIVVAGQEVTALPPARRRFGMVFQHYALFPHLTVGENVAFGLEAQGVPRAELGGRVARALELVDLPGFEPRRVGEISGGQQQRVALARALAPEPRLLLLDEPLSNLDPSLRERTRRELRAALRRVGITSLFVTHEQEEAFALGDRVALLAGGRLHQVGTAEELYRRPATRFAAGFVGRASVLPGRAEEVSGEEARVRLDAGAVWRAVATAGVRPGGRVELLVRPESVEFAESVTDDGQSVTNDTTEMADDGSLRGKIVERRFAGAAACFVLALERGGELEVLAAAGPALGEDALVVPARRPQARPLAFPAPESEGR
jgi:iron(III) transport system ATP-binding protein